MNRDCCKYCKNLVINIIEPSDIQLCGKHNKQVHKTEDKCKDYIYEVDSINKWQEIEELQEKLLNDPDSDINRSRYDVN